MEGKARLSSANQNTSKGRKHWTFESLYFLSFYLFEIVLTWFIFCMYLYNIYSATVLCWTGVHPPESEEEFGLAKQSDCLTTWAQQ